MQVRFLLITVVAAMLFAGCKLQDSLLYFPGSVLPTAEALQGARLKPWPSTAIADYRGLVASDDAQSSKGTAVVFHGNGGSALDRLFYVEMLTGLGYRVILAEYPGYGGRQGRLGEKAFVEDALETVRLVSAQFGEPLLLLGESLGAGVAAAVAKATTANLEGVILITPWDTLAAIAQAKFPFLPVRLLLTDTYDNIANLRSYPGRIAVVGAGRDEVVPVSHADNLFRALATPAKRMWLLKEAGHNDILFYTNPIWWQEVMNFATGKDKD